MTTCYAYTRVSTVKQGEGASLEAQKSAIERYAEQHNITITRWYEEKETAAKTGRPVFSDVMKNLKRGRAQGLVVHKIDRSARNFRDWAQIGDLADIGVEIHFATESLDFGSRGGRLVADIQAVVAADYVRNLKEESLKGQRMRLEQGIYPYKAPIGYIDNGKGNLKTICPEKGPLVIELFELYATGNHTLHTLAEHMTERGLTSFRDGPLTKSHVEKMLRNPFYTGKIHVRTTGKTFEGKHDPLISPQLYNAAQSVKHIRFGKKVTKHNHLLRGLFHCGHCDGSMIPELQKGTVYYRCHTQGCDTKSITEEHLLTEIDQNLAGLQMSAADREAVQAALRDIDKRLEDDPVLTIGEREIEKLKAREAALADKLLDGVFSDELFREKQSEISDAVLTWKHRMRKATEKAKLGEGVRAAVQRLDEFRFAFQIATLDHKRALLKKLYSNCSVSGKNVYFAPQNWVRAVQNLGSVSQCAHSITQSRTDRILEIIKDFDYDME